MSIVDKVLLVNLILLLGVCVLCRLFAAAGYVLNSVNKKAALGFWILLSGLSVFVWVVFKVVTW